MGTETRCSSVVILIPLIMCTTHSWTQWCLKYCTDLVVQHEACVYVCLSGGIHFHLLVATYFHSSSDLVGTVHRSSFPLVRRTGRPRETSSTSLAWRVSIHRSSPTPAAAATEEKGASTALLLWPHRGAGQVCATSVCTHSPHTVPKWVLLWQQCI